MTYGRGGGETPQLCFINPGFTDIFEFHMTLINSLPNDKILDQSNLKTWTDGKMNVAERLKFVLGR